VSGPVTGGPAIAIVTEPRQERNRTGFSIHPTIMRHRNPFVFDSMERVTDLIQPLAPQSVHLWLIDLDLQRECVPFLANLLSAAEHSRICRFHTNELQIRYIAAHGALRCILAAYLRSHPGEVCLAAGPGGKPTLADSRIKLSFNLSHSDELSVAAVAAGEEVGIDIERVKCLPELLSLASMFFSAVEITELRALSRDQRALGFFLGWTRKEAFIKATGEGLSRRLDSFSVSLNPQAVPRLIEVDRTETAANAWSLYSCRPRRGYVAAAIVRCRSPTWLWILR
jgi:4'-phosphopantetheinyl transferase